MELEIYFELNQKKLLTLANEVAGKKLLKVPEGLRVVYLTPNSVHFKKGDTYEANIWPNTTVAEILCPILDSLNILLERKYRYDKSLLNHVLGDSHQNLPTVLFQTKDITPSNGAANGEGILSSPNTSFDTFANCRAGTTGVGTGLSNPTGEFSYFIGFSGGQYSLSRYFFKIDYSSIPGGAKISSLVWNHFSRYATNNSTHLEDMVFVQGNQGTLTTGDWTGIGSTNLGRLTAATPSGGGSTWETLALNATAIAAITPGSTAYEYAWIHGADFDNSAPGTGNSGPLTYTANASTTGNRPYMRVTYEPAGGLLMAQI